MARTERARTALVAQLAARAMGREYLALVHGLVDADDGLIDAPLGRSGRDRLRIRVEAGGREARTRYRGAGPLRRPAPEPPCCGAGWRPAGPTRSGSTWRSVGHPVRRRRPLRARRGQPRWLAAPPGGTGRSSTPGLAFDHPRQGALVTFTSPLPADLVEVLAGFR